MRVRGRRKNRPRGMLEYEFYAFVPLGCIIYTYLEAGTIAPAGSEEQVIGHRVDDGESCAGRRVSRRLLGDCCTRLPRSRRVLR